MKSKQRKTHSAFSLLPLLIVKCRRVAHCWPTAHVLISKLILKSSGSLTKHIQTTGALESHGSVQTLARKTSRLQTWKMRASRLTHLRAGLDLCCPAVRDVLDPNDSPCRLLDRLCIALGGKLSSNRTVQPCDCLDLREHCVVAGASLREYLRQVDRWAGTTVGWRLTLTACCAHTECLSNRLLFQKGSVPFPNVFYQIFSAWTCRLNLMDM